MSYLTKDSVHQQVPVEVNQVQNNAGGYTFALDDWGRLERFLILGAEGGTYYVGKRNFLAQQIKCLQRCVQQDSVRVAELALEVSQSGRAPRVDESLYVSAYALVNGNEATKKFVLDTFELLARTGSHLFMFVDFAKRICGRFPKCLKKCVQAWYMSKDEDDLAYQMLKYRNRNGWTHGDLLRLSHVNVQADLARFALGIGGGRREVVRHTSKGLRFDAYPSAPVCSRLLHGYMLAQEAENARAMAELVERYRLTHEMVPTKWAQDPLVQEQLLVDMPIGATLRQLGRMTACRVLAPLSEATKVVCSRLTSEERLRKGRIHPLAVLNAMGTYQNGHGLKGSLLWDPVGAVSDALEEAFYKSFDTVEPSGKNIVLAMDVSASMDWGPIAGTCLTPREAAACLAMVTMRTEPNWAIGVFSDEFRWLHMPSRMPLERVVRAFREFPFGGTDCALPMIEAKKRKMDVDAFVVYTDNETWYGDIHPHRALREYRQASGRDAKLIVVGMTATEFTIADPNDAGMMDVVGFDTSAPAVMSDFIGR